MKKKHIKKFATYTVVIALLGTCGVMRLCKEKSREFADNTIRYTNEFVDDDFLIAAHRGFSSVGVENTEDALRTAANAEYVDYIELDVRLTADGKLVCVHNDTVIDSKWQKQTIKEMNYSDMDDEVFKYFDMDFGDFASSLFSATEGSILRERTIELFGSEYSILKLDDALDRCGDKGILIDLKFDDDFEEFVNALMESIQEIDSSRIVLQSADLKSLKKLQELYPEYNYLAIVSKESDFSECESFHMLGVRKNLIDSSLVDDALSEGKTLSIWTINTTKELEDVTESLGDSYDDVIYITDYPDVIASHLNTIQIQKKKVTTQ